MYTIYSKDDCPFCTKAKELLEARGLPYKELKLGVDYTRDYLVANIIPVGRRVTVPQIFVGEIYIGGSDNLEVYLEETSVGGGDEV